MAKTVALAELAERVGGSLDDAVQTVDQANGRAKGLRLSVPAGVAEELVDTYERVAAIVAEEQRALAVARSAYSRYEQDHGRARYAAGADAYNAAYEARRQRDLAELQADGNWSFPTGYSGGPACVTAGRAARDKALEAWDRRHPLRDFETFRRKGANLP